MRIQRGLTLRIILITIGSFGDVQPFVGLGMRLKQRGHEVLLITNGYFRPMAERAELDFAPLGDPELYKRVLEDPNMWHPIRGLKTVFTLGVNPSIKPMYELIMERYVPGQTLVVGSSLALGARIAEDRHGIPTATIHLAPGVFRSLIDPPRLSAASPPRGTPAIIQRGLWAAVDRWIVDPVVAPAVNTLRREVGLAPVKRLLDRWWHSPRLTIGMFPEWFAPPAPDWPPQVRLTGFPLYDQIGLEATPPELETFLADGDSPIVFTAGSAMAHGHRFFQSAVDACRRLRRRGLLLARFAAQVPRHLPPTVRHVQYAPFSQVLSRCAAIVHHGGIGTTAQSLRAGIPQLITPMSHDQPDNAVRVKRLGVGDFISPRRFTPKRAARLLGALLESSGVAANCRTVASRFDRADGLGNACDLIERLMTNDLAPPAARR